MSKIRIFFLFFFSLLLITFSVSAQENRGFSVSPPSFEINANPGNVIKNTIKIENLSNETQIFQSRPENFVTYGEGGSVSITEEESSFSIRRWITVDDDEQKIAPNGFALFDFTIDIPTQAEPGSHYGAIIFTNTPVDKIKGSGATVAQEIGSLILIKIPGDVFEEAKLKSFKPESGVFRLGRVKLLALIENTGNIHVKPYGSIHLTNIFGKKVKSVEAKGRNVLPGSKRLFEEEFKFNGFGYYKAEITLIYSGGGKILKGETGFFIYNQRTLTRYLIIGGILLAIYLVLRKRVNRAVGVLFKG